MIIGDKTWLHHVIPETKVDFMTSKSTKKLMASAFWNANNLLLKDFRPHDEPANAAEHIVKHWAG